MLSVERLSKLRNKDEFLFENISFTIQKNCIVVIRGASGTGKTTLLKCLNMLIQSDDGTILFKQNLIKDIPTFRSLVLYVPQRPPPFNGTPMELYNLLSKFNAQKNKRDVTDPISIAAKWNIEENCWSKDWSNLSGGELQRVCLAMAVSRNPDILLLDEPTSALDLQTMLLVEDTLKQFTCIWVTHSNEQEQRVATHTITLGNGSVLYSKSDEACTFPNLLAT